MAFLSDGVRLALAAGLCSAALVPASAAHAQQILSAIESEWHGTGPSDNVVSGVAGALIQTNYGGVDTRALTDYGVNKVFTRGNADYQQYTTSAWVDGYTVGGAAGTLVDLSFVFSFDGVVDLPPVTGASYNFSVFALGGTNWSANGFSDAGGSTNFALPGTRYERIFLNQLRPDGGVTQMDARSFDGFGNYGPNGVLINPLSPYVTYHPLLETASLCRPQECEDSGVYPATDLVLTFQLMAGSTFSIASVLWVDDVNEGTADFFNTAKLNHVSATPGATLTSQSGALRAAPGGGFQYPAAAATPAVPEPASWMLMIGGLALAGAAVRRKAQRSASLA